MAGYENPGYGVGSANSESQVNVEGADQHVGTKGKFTKKVQPQIMIQGVLQIVIGIICILSQTIVIIWALHIYSCLWTAFFFILHTEPVPSDAAGIWCGLMFLATGIVGVCASKRNTRKWVLAYMVCCIICSLLVFVVIGLALLNISDVNKLICTHTNTLPYGFDGLMIAVTVVELIVSVWSTVLACDARYGCCQTPEAAEYYNVMYNQSSSTVNLPSATADETPTNMVNQLPAYSELSVPAVEKY